MTTLHNPQPGLARRILCSPPARVLVLGFILLLMMGLNEDVMTSYADVPLKAIQHIMALAIAGLAVTSGTANTEPAMSICPPCGGVTVPRDITMV